VGAFYNSVGGQHDFESMRGVVLGGRRRTGVVDEIALKNLELPVLGLAFIDEGLDGDAAHAGFGVEDGDVAGAVVGRGDEVRAALMDDAHEVGAVAWLV